MAYVPADVIKMIYEQDKPESDKKITFAKEAIKKEVKKSNKK